MSLCTWQLHFDDDPCIDESWKKKVMTGNGSTENRSGLSAEEMTNKLCDSSSFQSNSDLTDTLIALLSCPDFEFICMGFPLQSPI